MQGLKLFNVGKTGHWGQQLSYAAIAWTVFLCFILNDIVTLNMYAIIRCKYMYIQIS